MRVVNVTHFKARTLTAQTTWTECRDTSLVRHLTQRVRLVHKLRQLVRSKEAVDHGTQRLGVDQIRRREHLVVTNVHALANGPSHPCETHSKLRVQLLTHGADAAVAQVIDVVHIRVAVDEVEQRLDDANDVVGRQSARLFSFNAQLAVDAETSHLTQIVTLF